MEIYEHYNLDRDTCEECGWPIESCQCLDNDDSDWGRAEDEAIAIERQQNHEPS